MMEHLSDGQLNEYLDGELPEATRQGAGLHLQGCQTCRERLVSLEKVARLLADLPVEQPVHDLQAVVLGEVRAQTQRLAPVWMVLLAVQGGTLLALCLLAARHLLGWVPLAEGWQALTGQLLRLDLSLPGQMPPLVPHFAFLPPDLQASPAGLAFLAVSALLLWSLGNALLLRHRNEVHS